MREEVRTDRRKARISAAYGRNKFRLAYEEGDEKRR